MTSFRQYTLSIQTDGDGGTSVRVQEWDIPASKYPTRHASIKLAGVEFPAHRDALEALRVALDLLESGG